MTDRLVLHTRVVTGSGGGPDKTILNSPRFLKKAGFDTICAYMRHPKDGLFEVLRQRAEKWDATVLPVDDFGPFDWRLAGRFRRICAEHRPLIWHGHDYKSNLLGLLARRHQPMLLITTVHGWVKHTIKTPLYYAIDRFCLRRYDEVICVSQDLYDACLTLGVPPERCWHVPNAIDTEEFDRREPAEAAKARLGIPAGRLLVGAIGRLSDEKAFHLLIEAVGRLAGQGHDIELWIAGEGDQQQILQQLIDRRGLNERVKLKGFCSDTLTLYHAMDIFALTSIREGLPNVLLEAMAMRVPILATKVAGIPKLIEHEQTGVLIEPGSVDAISAGLARLLESQPLRQRLAEAGRMTIETKYSFQKRMDRIVEIYETALARRGNP